jgi:hypothetical protein
MVLRTAAKRVLPFFFACLLLCAFRARASGEKIHAPGKRGSNVAKTAVGYALLGLGLADGGAGLLVIVIGHSALFDCAPDDPACSDESLGELRRLFYLVGGAAVIMGTGMVITGLALLSTRKYVRPILPPGSRLRRLRPFVGFDPARRLWHGGLALVF